MELPPLRNRPEDIGPLADHFLDRLARQLGRRRSRLTLANLQQLQKYAWPGNVRELRHVLERACIVATDGRLRFDLPTDSSKQREEPAEATTTKSILTDAEMRRFEANNIRAALESSKGKIYGNEGAAARLGMKPTTLASRIKALRVRVDP
jgi:transcriptional regulator with GAF, ATPase, and Fis domain